MKYWITTFLFLIACTVPFALAVNRAPTYDYAGGTYNLTCTNSPVYNTTSRSFVFGPAGNQKCDPANNWSTAVLPTNASPYTEMAWINIASFTPAGASYHLSNIQFNFSENRGYSHRFEYNSTQGIRPQVITGGTFLTGNFTPGFSLNTWVPIIYEFNGTAIRVTVNGTLLLNSATTGRSLATSGGNNQFYGSGTGGGLSNGMWNGTVKYHARYNRLLSDAEKLVWFNNQTINTTGLVSWHTFENTTGVNATIGTTSLGPMPSHSLGWHSELFLSNATLIDVNNDGTLDTLANVTELYNAALQSGATYFRSDMNLDIVCTWNGAGCTWQYTNALNARNFSLHLSNHKWIADNGGKQVLILESVPQQLANNNSNCNFGVGSDWSRCEPTSYAHLHTAASNYIDQMVAVGGQDSIACLEVYNEPYLPQFWLPNSSVTTDLRVQRMLVWSDEITSRFAVSHPWLTICGPSVTFGSSAAGLQFMHSFYGNRTASHPLAPDLATTHEYGSSGVMGIVRTNIESAIAILNGYGYTNRIVVTETLTNNDIVSQFNQPRMEAETANAYFGGILGGVQGMNVFRFTDGRPWSNLTTEFPAKYPQFYITQLQGPYYGGGYTGVERVQYLQSGTQYFSCSTTDSAVTCLATRAGDKYYVSFANMKGNQIQVDTLTIPGATITAARMLTDTQPVAFSGDEAYLAYNNWFGVQTYELTVELTEISFNTTVPVTQNFTTTQGNPVSFTATMNNPDSIPVIYSWFINSVNQTSVYGDTTINTNLVSGNYTVNLSVYSSENTVNYFWNMQILPPAPIVPATTCSEATVGVAGLSVFTKNIGIMALAVMMVAIVSLVMGITNGTQGAELVYEVLRNVVIAAVVMIMLVFIVAIGSEIAINTACR